MTTMSDPARNAAAVTPSDSTILGPVRAVYVGTTGNLAVQFEAGGTTVTFPDVLAGQIYPIRVARIMSTGTTASGIVALY